MNCSNKKTHYSLLFFITCIALIFLIIFCSTLGVANISFVQSIKILLSKIPLIGDYVSLEGIKSTSLTIVFNIRLPRIFTAALVGAALSVVGAVYQGIFKNPMADPYVLGVSSGAAVGATIAIVLGLSTTFYGFGMINVLAFAGAILTILIAYNIARVGNKLPSTTLLLAGVVLSFLFSSINSLLMFFNRDQVESIVFWLMGSFNGANWSQLTIAAPIIIIGIIFIIAFSKDLNLMLLGEDTAKNLGTEVEKVKKLLLFITSVMISSSVSISGVIGFVGLITPHVIRIIIGPDNKRLIPFSALGGAIFMIISDTLARILIPPIEIPVGAITSLFGAPYFIYLLMKRKKTL